jgi:6-phosphogluconolactonase (cycloisomerase 2 family)
MKLTSLAVLLALVAGVVSCGGGSSGHFLYVIGPGSNSVFGFQQTSDGGITALTSPFDTDSEPVSMVIHPSGLLAFVANFAGNNISIYTRDKKGHLSAAKDPVTGNLVGPIAAGTNPVSVTLSPNGNFLYVLNQGSSNISVFSVDQTDGALTPLKNNPTTSTPANPRAMVAAPNGKFLYIANPTLGTISGFVMGSDGSLSTISGSPFNAGTSPAWVTVDPQSKFLYVADQSANQILAFTIDAGTGVPSAISGSPFNAGTHPVSLATDSSGVLLVAANQGSNNISAYSINTSSGALSQISGSPFGTGISPDFVTVDFTNSFVYVGDSVSNDLTVFAIKSGALTAVSGSPFNVPTSPAWITSR